MTRFDSSVVGGAEDPSSWLNDCGREFNEQPVVLVRFEDLPFRVSREGGRVEEARPLALIVLAAACSGSDAAADADAAMDAAANPCAVDAMGDMADDAVDGAAEAAGDMVDDAADAAGDMVDDAAAAADAATEE